MKKIQLLILLLLASTRLFAQSAIATPNIIEAYYVSQWQSLNPWYVQTADGKFMESKLLRGARANLYFRSFGFDIALNASIEGIDVRVTRKKRGASEVKDVFVTLLKPINDREGMGNGPDLANKDVLWTENLTTVLYAFPKTALDKDRNTFTWTPADLNSGGFGLRFDTYVGSGKGAYIQFDKVELTVRYTTGTTVSTQTRELEQTSPAVLKQLGNRFQLNVQKEGTYRFTVRDRNGVVLQQSTLQGRKDALLTVEAKSKGYCIITVEGPSTTISLQAIIR